MPLNTKYQVPMAGYFKSYSLCLSLIWYSLELTPLVLKITHLDTHDHSHSLTNFHNSGDFAGPRTLSNLDLHPTLEIVSQEICCHGIYHINLTIIKSILVKLGGISQEIINIKGVLCLWINPLVNNMITHGSATEIFSRNIRRQSGWHGFLN